MRRAFVLAGLTFVMALAPGAGAAKPTKLADGVIAIIADRPILLSELRQRTAFAAPTPAKAVLERMIDERVIERDGNQASITVTPEEVDDGIRDANAPRRASAMSEQDHRDDVRRWLFERKWVKQRLEPLLKPGANLETERRKRLDELRREYDVEVFS